MYLCRLWIGRGGITGSVAKSVSGVRRGGLWAELKSPMIALPPCDRFGGTGN